MRRRSVAGDGPPSTRTRSTSRPSQAGGSGSALRQVLEFDRSAIRPAAAARAAATVTVVLVVGAVCFGRTVGATATVGALLAGYPAVGSLARRPLPTMAAVAAGMALATFVGSATGSLGWVQLLVLGPWAFASGLSVAFGDGAASVGVQTTVAFIVFGRFSEPPVRAALLGAEVAAGAAVQVVVTAVTNFVAPRAAGTTVSRRRQLVAEAYAALADLADEGGRADQGAGAGGGAPESAGATSATDAAGAALDAAEAALPGAGPGDRRELSTLWSLVAEGRRLRVSLAAVATLEDRVAARPGGGDRLRARLAATRRQSAAELRALALRVGRDVAAADAGTAGPGVSDHAGDGFAALAGQLRAADRLARRLDDDGAGRADLNQVIGAARSWIGRWTERSGERVATVRANLSLASPAFRHAVRLAVVVCVAELIAAHTPLQRGYWVALTAAVVLKPDYGVTFARGASRLVGTVVGVGLAGALLLAVHSDEWTTVAAIAVLVAGCYLVFPASYGVFSILVTGLIVLLVGLAQPQAFSVATDRLLDTLIGGGLALAAYAAWPTWTAARSLDALRDLIEADRAYLGAVVAAVAGAAVAVPDIGAAARRVRLARSRAVALRRQSLAEPRARRVDAGRTGAVLGGADRVARATHALRLVAADRPGAAVPEVAPLAAALDGALAGAAAAAGSEGPARPVGALGPPAALRDRYGELRAALGPRADEVPALLALCDELVDAVNTLGSVLQAPGLHPASERPGHRPS